MIDLNGEEFKSQNVLIFNNGVAGRAENVSINVERKGPEGQDNAPEYKVIFTDDLGASINMGIYYPTPNSQFDDAKNESLARLNVGKVLSIAKSVLGNDYVFPAVSGSKEAIDVILKLTKDNCDGKKVNIFPTYGTKGSPKKYLGIYKNFDFIEAARTTNSRLRQTINVDPSKSQYNDLMERIVEDAENNENSEQPKTQSWL